MQLKPFLIAEATRLGFLRARVASVHAPVDMSHYDAFLAAGWHGEMDWLATSRDARAEVARLLPGARSVLTMAFDYTRALPPDPGGLTGRVASYAWGRDYHNFVTKRVRRLQRSLNRSFPGVDSYAAVDSRPVYERAWAARAGLGFTGRNAFQILPGDTCSFFIATLFVVAEMEPDAPLGDHCGACRRCVDACPTQAILPSGGLIANQCISYLTIEHESAVPRALRPKLGRWVFGCDVCQDVCPHQSQRRLPPEETLPTNAWLNLPELVVMPDDALAARFVGSPIRRAAGERIRRNAAYALGNLHDAAALPSLEVARREGGLVADAAEWAIDHVRGRE
ncbi:epoxyqueuosine reductase [Deltaproteobacteria bacterium]|nr:epoxyqueuosine reductase [Deltaproteobacteria bacterium]